LPSTIIEIGTQGATTCEFNIEQPAGDQPNLFVDPTVPQGRANLLGNAGF
jgi:hypothetical protein